MEFAYPIRWPAAAARTPPHQREAGGFSRNGKTYYKFETELHAELTRMRAQAVIVETDRRVNQDGTLHRADRDREPADPGIVLYFTRKKQQLVFACDRFDKLWKNMRALTLTIEALRGIDRWGSVEMQDQAFRGYAALPPPDAGTIEMPGPGALPQPWHIVLGVEESAPWSAIRTAFREKMRDADDRAKLSLNLAYEAAKQFTGFGA